MSTENRDTLQFRIPRGLRGTLAVLVGIAIPTAVIGLPLCWYLTTWSVTP